jgi:cytochrome c oxidase subunit III
MATTINSHSVAIAQNRRAAGQVAVASSNADRASRSGIWVGIFAITMSFAAFTSALFVREGTTDWGHLALPSVLYLNTFVLLASSAALEFSRRSLAPGRLIQPGSARKSSTLLLVALFLGLAFCVGQYSAWQQLRAQGLYLASNPNSSFFYVLTFIHVLHALAGILALLYLAARLIAGRSAVRRSFFDNTAIYWHFIGVLWLYLFLLCRFKL